MSSQMKSAKPKRSSRENRALDNHAPFEGAGFFAARVSVLTCTFARETPPRRRCQALILCLSLLGASCRKNKGDQDTVPRPPEQIGAPALTASASGSGESKARAYYKSRCSSCHGDSGRGDGSGLTSLNLKHKPRDYTDPEWQRSVTDDDIRKIILYGGASIGRSPDMPAFGDLQGKSELLEQLVTIIRSFGKT